VSNIESLAAPRTADETVVLQYLGERKMKRGEGRKRRRRKRSERQRARRFRI
jgi:hypothetical protein